MAHKIATNSSDCAETETLAYQRRGTQFISNTCSSASAKTTKIPEQNAAIT